MIGYELTLFFARREPKGLHWIDQEKCHKCGVCFEVCPPRVFSVEKRTGDLEIHTGEGESL